MGIWVCALYWSVLTFTLSKLKQIEKELCCDRRTNTRLPLTCKSDAALWNSFTTDVSLLKVKVLFELYHMALNFEKAVFCVSRKHIHVAHDWYKNVFQTFPRDISKVGFTRIKSAPFLRFQLLCNVSYNANEQKLCCTHSCSRAHWCPCFLTP